MTVVCLTGVMAVHHGDEGTELILLENTLVSYNNSITPSNEVIDIYIQNVFSLKEIFIDFNT